MPDHDTPPDEAAPEAPVDAGTAADSVAGAAGPAVGTGPEGASGAEPATAEAAAVAEATGSDVVGAEAAVAETAVAEEEAAGPDAAGAAEALEGNGAAETGASRRRARAEARVDAIRAQGVDVHPPTALERGSYAIVRGAFLGLAKLYFRLEVRGTDNVPAHGPFVLAPVHRSYIDFLLASTVTRTRMRYMGKAAIWKWRPGGAFVAMLGAFPVHRGSADREALRTCMEVIENGEPLVMFPEGTRQSGPQLSDTFDGPAYVALRTGVPLVPVGIGGSDRAMPRGARFVFPRKVVVVVGEPIQPPAGDGSGRVSRRVVRETSRRLDDAIQQAFDEARRRAGVP